MAQQDSRLSELDPIPALADDDLFYVVDVSTGESHSVEKSALGATDDTTVNNHIADVSAAHAASAVSIVDIGGHFTGGDVEAALQELGAGGGGGVTLEEVQDDLGNTSLVAGTSLTKVYDDAAGTITLNVDAADFDPAGSAAAAQAASQPLDADLTALAAAGNSATLAATTASFLTADESKLDGIAAGATDDTTVNNHIADTSAAHAASAISVADVEESFTEVNVEGVLQELATIIETVDNTPATFDPQSYPGVITVVQYMTVAVSGVGADGWYHPGDTTAVADLTGRVGPVEWHGTAAQKPADGSTATSFRIGDKFIKRPDAETL